MKIIKDSVLSAAETVSPQDMAAINALAKTELLPEQVYTFAVRLCDNEVDRDFERFTEPSLETLGGLFCGKAGIFDHNWTAKGQKARIFRTEIVREPEKTTLAGDGYAYLKGWAYMLRLSENEALIREIEGGIKKEVSVGCAVSAARCSVCGKAIGSADCAHTRGKTYGAKLCYAELEEPTDAFEWSFVAVPAQRAAGVIKAFEREEKMTLDEVVRGHALCEAELEKLKQEAELGRTYMLRLRGELKRLAGLTQPELDGEMLAEVSKKLTERELISFIGAFEQQLNKSFPVAVQLAGETPAFKAETEFMI